MPSVFVPIRGSKSGGGINSLAMDGGLSGVGLRAVLGEAVDAPNTLVRHSIVCSIGFDPIVWLQWKEVTVTPSEI